jgi:hypothetical protein
LRLAALTVEARWLATGPNVSAEVRVRLLQLPGAVRGKRASDAESR